MIIAMLKLMVAPDKKAEVIEILEALVGPAEAQPGCLGCRLYADMGIDDEMLMVQEWKAKNPLERYLCSDSFEKVLAVMDMACAPPSLAFHTVSETRGMELIEKLCIMEKGAT